MVKRFAIAVIVLALVVLATPWVISNTAQVLTSNVGNLVRLTLTTGSGRSVAIPAYLFDAHLMATTAGTTIKDSAGVLGCVQINTAGASGSLVKVYDMTSTMTANNQILIASIDSASALKAPSCFGSIFTDGLTVVITSSGAAPDVTLTYR